MSEVIDFNDLSPIEIEVKIQGQAYTLREASGAAAVAYRNACMSCSTFGSNGKIAGIQGLANVEPLFVSLCLFDDKGRNVSQKTIMAWPSRVQKKLFATAQKISGMQEDSKERSLLEEALNLEASPSSYAGVKDFILNLEDEKFKPLQDWLRVEEDSEKNSPSGIAAGSLSPTS